MDEPLDDLYLVWLYRQVGDPDSYDHLSTYWRLFKQLYQKEFVWVVPNDDNRIADGKELRHEFAGCEGLEVLDEDWFSLGCSMLELFVGLSRRLSFQLGGEPRDWFWHLLSNIRLANCNDGRRFSVRSVDEILDQIIWRTYEPDGRGGLFPLANARQDQRTIEIWYQLSAYVLERF